MAGALLALFWSLIAMIGAMSALALIMGIKTGMQQ